MATYDTPVEVATIPDGIHYAPTVEIGYRSWMAHRHPEGTVVDLRMFRGQGPLGYHPDQLTEWGVPDHMIDAAGKSNPPGFVLFGGPPPSVNRARIDAVPVSADRPPMSATDASNHNGANMQTPDYDAYQIARVGITTLGHAFDRLPIRWARLTIDVDSLDMDIARTMPRVLLDLSSHADLAEFLGNPAISGEVFDASMGPTIVFRAGRSAIFTALGDHLLVLVPHGSPFAYRFGSPL